MNSMNIVKNRFVDDNVITLRGILAAFLERRSDPLLTEEDRKFCQEGIDALQYAIETIECQVYA